MYITNLLQYLDEKEEQPILIKPVYDNTTPITGPPQDIGGVSLLLRFS
jgi:hypothetical protein